MNVFETLICALIDKLPRTEKDKAVDAAIETLIAKVKVSDNYIQEENKLYDCIGENMNQIYERGIRQGVQLITEALTNSICGNNR